VEDSVPGLIGAGIGFVVGWVQYKLVAGVVVAGLRRTNNSKTQAEYDDYERRIRLLQAILLVMMVLGLPIMGYVIGRTAFG
jgi:biotin transporter BioY